MSDIGTGAAIFGCAGAVLTAEEVAFFRDYDPLGFILFARNVETPDQLKRLTADLRDAVGRDAMIMVDQEGGRVQRLRAPYWREWLPPLDTVEIAGANAAKAMNLRSRIIAKELRSMGIDANCAPVADIASDVTHPFLRNRCYGSTATEVIAIARAVADGHLAEGVLPVIKHMPGHGRSTADTHHDLPHVSEPLDALIASDFAPFIALKDVPIAMTAHIIFTALDPVNPATQSLAVLHAIRQIIGFDGLLLTDDLNMQALSGTLAARTRLSMAAGCDIALHCKGDMDQMVEVAAEAGEMTAVTKIRAVRALALRKEPSADDVASLDAELATLMAG